MSKQDRFKSLLQTESETGEKQKEKLLKMELFPSPPKSKPIVSDEQSDSDSKTGDTNVKPEGKEIGTPLNPTSTSETSHHTVIGSENQEFNTDNHNNLNVDSDQYKSASALSHVQSQSNEPTQPPPSQNHFDLGNIHEILQSSLPELSEMSIDETHTRKTYLIHNELLREFDKLAAGKKKGFRTKVVNAGLRIILEQLKENKGKINT